MTWTESNQFSLVSCCFSRTGSTDRDSRSPHMPNIFISQLHSLNGALLSRGVIIFVSHPGVGLQGKASFCGGICCKNQAHYTYSEPLVLARVIRPGIKCCAQMAGTMHQLTVPHSPVIINRALKVWAQMSWYCGRPQTRMRLRFHWFQKTQVCLWLYGCLCVCVCSWVYWSTKYVTDVLQNCIIKGNKSNYTSWFLWLHTVY